MSTLIKNGRIITAEEDHTADIFIENENISLIEKDLTIEADTIIDANGKFVIPGGIDVHTHLDMPYRGITTSSDDFETGTIAAAFGGTTTIIDFANQTKGKSLREGLETWMKKAEGKAVIDYSFHASVTDLVDNWQQEMKDLADEGVTSFKLFTAYPNDLMLDDGSIFKVMSESAKLGTMILMHAENGPVIDLLIEQMISEGKVEPKYHALSRPIAAEAEATNRAIAIAKMAGAPLYIVHLTCDDALKKVAEARSKGLPVFAETCPQYLYLSIDDISKPGFEGAKFVFSPPVREKFHQEKLWAGLKNNDLQTVATDHCPFNFKGQKDLGKSDFTKIPNGGPGIENRLHLTFQGGVNEGRFSLNRWVDIISTTPAKLFGLYPQKGNIAVGADADIVIWDPNAEHTISAETHHMNCDYSLYEGIKIKGNAETVISRGEIIISENNFKGKTGRGNFVKRTLPLLD